MHGHESCAIIMHKQIMQTSANVRVYFKKNLELHKLLGMLYEESRV